MKILVVGKYNPEYNRTKILLDGLRKTEGIEVIEMPFSKKKYFDIEEFKKQEKNCDVIYAPPFSHKYVLFLKRISTKPFVFDPLISNYLTKVFDYKSVFKWSPRAYKNYLKDKLPFKAVDLLIADTFEHKMYYHKTFGIDLDMIKVLPVGANVSDFSPVESGINTAFQVGFYGGFIPLQGVKYIIETAEILKNQKDIHFYLIGTGFQYEEMKQLVVDKKLSNITFEGWIDYSKLSSHLNSYDVCLGIFGDTPKAQLVIPNKIFHYAAMGKSIITMKTKAISEVFTNGKNIVLTENNPKEISEVILTLKQDKGLNFKLGSEALELINKEYNELKIAEKFLEIVKSIS